MRNERRRGGGLYIGEMSAATLLREALALAPAAHVALMDRADLDGDELQSRLQSAAYLVLPMPAADPPRALIEAFANAVPVIASRAGSLAELVEPGRNGLVFEPGSARDLARQLMWAEAFPEKMRQMGECARADYLARFISRWSYPTLFGERRRAARA